VREPLRRDLLHLLWELLRHGLLLPLPELLRRDLPLPLPARRDLLLSLPELVLWRVKARFRLEQVMQEHNHIN